MNLKIRCYYGIGFLKAWGIQAITIYPFIFFACEKKLVPSALFRHELEHIYQVQRLGWIKLYTSYLQCYFKNRYKGLNHYQAYWAIPYEIEARCAEGTALSEIEVALLNAENSNVAPNA